MADNTLQEKIKAVKLYLSGTSPKEIGLEFNVTRTTLHRWVKKYKDKISDFETEPLPATIVTGKQL